MRTELEDSIYSAASLVTGPQVTVFDLAGSKEGVDIAPQQYNLNAPLEIPAPPESYFRFANLRLRADVAINMPHLALQIGETLWQVLYPEMPGSTPSDFAETSPGRQCRRRGSLGRSRYRDRAEARRRGSHDRPSDLPRFAPTSATSSRSAAMLIDSPTVGQPSASVRAAAKPHRRPIVSMSVRCRPSWRRVRNLARERSGEAFAHASRSRSLPPLLRGQGSIS